MTAGFMAMSLSPSSAEAQEGSSDTITVTAPRHVERTTVGRSSIGAPIEDVTVSRRVSHHDLDLKSPAGRETLNRRITEAAQAECRELARIYPVGRPDSRQCARIAIAGTRDAVDLAIKSASAAR
jgi:UrcA family protein